MATAVQATAPSGVGHDMQVLDHDVPKPHRHRRRALFEDEEQAGSVGDSANRRRRVDRIASRTSAVLTFAKSSAKWTTSAERRACVPNIVIVTAKRVSASPACGVREHQPDRVDGHRQRVQAEHQVLGLSPMDEVRDAKGQPDADVREDPREKHSSEKLGEHPNRLSAGK